MSFANGDRYEGEYRGGKKHGKGKLSRRDGSVTAGLWRAGKFKG
jgi:hypothetical protein